MITFLNLKVSEVISCGSMAGGGGLLLLNSCCTAEFALGVWIVRISGVSNLKQTESKIVMVCIKQQSIIFWPIY